MRPDSSWQGADCKESPRNKIEKLKKNIFIRNFAMSAAILSDAEWADRFSRIIRKLWCEPFDLALKTNPRRLRLSTLSTSYGFLSDCHSERSEESVPSVTEPRLSQMLRMPALSPSAFTQDKLRRMGLSMTILLRVVSLPPGLLVILRRSMDPIRIHLLSMMSALVRRTLYSVGSENTHQSGTSNKCSPSFRCRMGR